MRIEKIEKETWKKMGEDAHKICFNEKMPRDRSRVDFALLAITNGDVPGGYITCRETDSETIYWAFGGAFPSIKGTALSYRAYMDFAAWSSVRYKRVVTYIENKNKVMLKMAAKLGFRITGIRNYNGEVLLEHLLDFEDFNGDH
jgi:RimJ/RimL family protein N-acetyltransferase